jgi:hypothetical protein
MSNLISKSEAQFRLRNVIAKLSIAQSAAKEGDWRIAFDNAYEAQDLLNILVPHIEEALDEHLAKRDPKPEPPGSLKYGVPPGTPTKRVGGMGYRGSNYDGNRPPEPITVTIDPVHVAPTKRGTDLRPPKPIITPPPTSPPPVIVTPPPKSPIITPPPEPPAPVIPDGAEVVTLDINRLLNGIANDGDREAMTLLYELPEEFRKTVLKTNALSRRPVTIYRVGDVWSIYR